MASNNLVAVSWTRRKMPTIVLLLSLLLQNAYAIRRVPSHVSQTNNSTFVRNLKNSAVPIPTSPKDHLVTSLPFLKQNDFATAHYAGLLPANAIKTKYFFYWLFEPDLGKNSLDDESEIPLLLWMNGGPGCSSMDGLFLEHGPFRLTRTSQDSWNMNIHDTSWHTAPAYVVYVDQPVGTGLSFTTDGDYPTNDEAVNRDFAYWLREFLLLYSNVFLNPDKTALKRPLYFSGESHAGHYIPSMIDYIHTHNTNNNDDLNIRVTGAAIGNGWVDPFHQYAGAEAAYGHGLVDLAQKQALDAQEKDCQFQLAKGNFHYGGCLGLLDDIVSQSEGKSGQHRISQYDARNWEKKHAARTFPLGHERIESYLGGWPTPKEDPGMNVMNDVLKAIHAEPSHEAGQRYMECTDPPYNALAHQDGLGVVDEVVSLLNDGVRLLFFNGMEDLICNHVGNEVLLMKLPWEHGNDWIQAKRYSWTAAKQSEVSGYVKEFENLTFLKVLHSGHMVPMDVPEVALDMMRVFMYETSFQSSEQDLQRAIEKAGAECPACPTCPDSSSNNALNPSDNGDNDTTEGDENLMQYVVAHSWIGAVVAVSVFVGAFLYVRRRQQRSAGNVTAYGNLEMKEGQGYSDRPGAADEDDDEEVIEMSNGNGII